MWTLIFSIPYVNLTRKVNFLMTNDLSGGLVRTQTIWGIGKKLSNVNFRKCGKSDAENVTNEH